MGAGRLHFTATAPKRKRALKGLNGLRLARNPQRRCLNPHRGRCPLCATRGDGTRKSRSGGRRPTPAQRLHSWGLYRAQRRRTSYVVRGGHRGNLRLQKRPTGHNLGLTAGSLARGGASEGTFGVGLASDNRFQRYGPPPLYPAIDWGWRVFGGSTGFRPRWAGQPSGPTPTGPTTSAMRMGHSGPGSGARAQPEVDRFIPRGGHPIFGPTRPL